MSMSGIELALGIQEALEEQVVADRIEVGDAQRVGNQAAGRRAAPRPDRNALSLGVVDEVGDDQEVSREAHLGDRSRALLEPRRGTPRVPRPDLGRTPPERDQALLRGPLGVAARAGPRAAFAAGFANDRELDTCRTRARDRSAWRSSSVFEIASGQSAKASSIVRGVLT